MELTSFQRVVAFIAVVFVLAGLGVYLFLPSASGAGRPPGRADGPRSPAPQRGSPSPSASPAASSTSGPLTPVDVPNIYSWLPFSQAGLASAARVTVEFADHYGTYSYAQGTAAYLAPMKPIVTSQLAQLIARAYATPGLASARASGRQVATGTAVITALRSYGPTSLTFVVTLTQRITSTKGATRQVTGYAITLTGGGTSWQVSDLELASAGNS